MPEEDRTRTLKDKAYQATQAFEGLSSASEDVNDQWAGLVKQMEKLEDTSRDLMARLLKDMKRINRREGKQTLKNLEKAEDGMEKLQEETKDTEKAAERLFNAMVKLKGSASNLSGVAQQGLGKAAEEAESWTVAMFDLGKELNLNIKARRELGAALAAESSNVSMFAISLHDSANAAEELARAGMVDTKMLAKFGPAVALVAKTTGESMAGVAKQFYVLNNRLGLSRDEITDVMAHLKISAGKNAVVFADMVELISGNADDLRTAMQGIPRDAQASVLKSLGSIRAGFEDIWGGGKNLTNLMTQAMAGQKDAVISLTAATGMGVEQWRTALQSSEGTVGAVNAMLAHMKTMQVDNNIAATELASKWGIQVAELRDLWQRGGQAVEQIKAINSATIKAGEGTKWWTKLQEDNQLASEAWGNRISHLAKVTIPGINMSLLDGMEIWKQLPIQQAHASYEVLAASKDMAKGVWQYITALYAKISATTAVTAAEGAMATSTTAAGVAASGASVGVWAMALPLLKVAAIVGVVVAVGYGLYKLFGYLYNRFETFRVVVDAVWGALKGVANFLWTMMKPVIEFHIQQWKTIGLAIGGAVMWAWGKLKEFWAWLDPMLTAMDKVVAHVLKNFPVYAAIAWEGMKSSLSNIWTGIQSMIDLGLGALKDKFTSFVANIKGVASGISAVISFAFKKMIDLYLITPINKMLEVKLPLVRKTIGQLAGMSPIPLLSAQPAAPTPGGRIEAGGTGIIPLQEGGLVTQPALATLAEREPEVVIPISEMTRVINDAMAEGGPGGGRDIKVDVHQKEVVDAIYRFMSLVEGMSRRNGNGRRPRGSGWEDDPVHAGAIGRN